MPEFLNKIKNKIKPSTANKSATLAHLPEKGPVNEDGKEVLLSVKNVDITFGKGDGAVKAVKNASFDIFKGETFSLVGESGSGKTTIGRAVIRVNPCAAGEILYKGVRISGKIPHSLDREVIRNVQMVFQDPAASLNERATVDYIVSEGLYNFHLFQNEADRVQKVETMIQEVGLLPEHLTRYPHEFSGGQRQRIGLARAMIMEPELVVADEPISALDVSIRAQVLNLLKKFQKERGVTYLFIAHDLSIVRFISDRIGVIYKGDIVEVAEADELFNYPLHPYTRSLISAIPIPDPQLEKHKELFTYDPSVHDEAKLAALEVAKAEKAEQDRLKAEELARQAAEMQAANPDQPVEEKKKDGGFAKFWCKVKGVFAKLFKRFKKPVSEEDGLNVEKPCLTDIGHGHFVFGYKSEIEEYKKVREAGVPVKSITIVNPNDKKATAKTAKAEKQQEKQEKKPEPAKEQILDRPVRDTGSIWYKLLSFFLPLVGLVLLFVFKAKNYIRNYKACKKGTIIGFSVIAAIIVLFCFFLILAVV